MKQAAGMVAGKSFIPLIILVVFLIIDWLISSRVSAATGLSYWWFFFGIVALGVWGMLLYRGAPWAKWALFAAVALFVISIAAPVFTGHRQDAVATNDQTTRSQDRQQTIGQTTQQGQAQSGATSQSLSTPASQSLSTQGAPECSGQATIALSLDDASIRDINPSTCFLQWGIQASPGTAVDKTQVDFLDITGKVITVVDTKGGIVRQIPRFVRLHKGSLPVTFLYRRWPSEEDWKRSQAH